MQCAKIYICIIYFFEVVNIEQQHVCGHHVRILRSLVRLVMLVGFLLAAVLYSFQLYADFSGYSDMAIGVGKLLGFKITDNFRYPFFATNIADSPPAMTPITWSEL